MVPPEFGIPDRVEVADRRPKGLPGLSVGVAAPSLWVPRIPSIPAEPVFRRSRSGNADCAMALDVLIVIVSA